MTTPSSPGGNKARMEAAERILRSAVRCIVNSGASAVTMHGPIGQNVSNVLPRHH